MTVFLFDPYLPTYPRYKPATYVRICTYIVQRNVTPRTITAYTCRVQTCNVVTICTYIVVRSVTLRKITAYTCR